MESFVSSSPQSRTIGIENGYILPEFLLLLVWFEAVARSATNEESRLRKDEAELKLQWVERAKKVEPSG